MRKALAFLTPFGPAGVRGAGDDRRADDRMILLFLLPFYDRGPERHPLRRPIATATGIFVICAMAYLTYLGRQRRTADANTITRRQRVARRRPAGGRAVLSRPLGRRPVRLRGVPQDRRQRQRWPGAGADAHRGSRCRRQAIARTLVNPTAADAVVREPAREAVLGRRRLPVRPEVVAARKTARHARGGPGARDVRPHRGRLRRDEHR